MAEAPISTILIKACRAERAARKSREGFRSETAIRSQKKIKAAEHERRPITGTRAARICVRTGTPERKSATKGFAPWNARDRPTEADV